MISKSTARQFISLLSTFFISLTYGLGVSWTPAAIQILPKSSSSILLSEEKISLLVISDEVGQLAISFLMLIFIETISRRKLLFVALLSQTGGFLLLSAFVSFSLLVVSRVILGIGFAILTIIAYVYVAEITCPRNRAILTSAILFVYAAGQTIELGLQVFENYQLICAVPLAFSVAGLISFYYTLESPYHLMMNNHREQALHNFSILHSSLTAEQVDLQFADLQKYVGEEKTEGVQFFHYIGLAENLKLFSFLLTIEAISYASGYWSFQVFGPIILKPYEASLNIMLVMNLFAVSGLLGAAVAPYIVDKVSRKTLFVSGFGVFVLLQVLLTAIFCIELGSEVRVAVLSYSIVTFITVLYIVSKVTVEPAIRIVSSETFPHALKVRGGCLMSIAKLIVSIGRNVIFFPVANFVGVGFNFLLYAVLAALACIYVLMYYRETKNMTLREARGQYR